jgi:hypothetical protein
MMNAYETRSIEATANREAVMKKLILLIVGAGLLWFDVALAEEGDIDPKGYLYGIVETESGTTYTGFLRWGREEAFWDDHFNAGKMDLPYREAQPREERRKRKIRIFGVTISYGQEHSDGRQFIARFGDIREIEPRRGNHTRVRMRSGAEFVVSDSSNDIGATVTVDDPALGRVKLDWDRIERIRFQQAPSEARPAARRLYGTLKTRDQTFEGFIQWDLHECLWTDELDGETEDGDVSIAMGQIQAIEKNNRHGAWVELRDGRRLLVENTNDVDHTTNGTFVEDARYGRVKIPWDEFERVDFESTGESGRGYDDYSATRHLAGTVTDHQEKTYGGEIVFDLDESEDWEFLNGSIGGVEYNVPFGLIRSLQTTSRDRTRVELDNGEELLLEDGNDVSAGNDGLIVLGAGDRGETYLAWRDVDRIQLDRSDSVN